ncbi:MAG: hypothetical protein LBS43_02325 [Prevotellaceae bacterium]|nr:hypothetical protein [Prevotellaceae bacterium]
MYIITGTGPTGGQGPYRYYWYLWTDEYRVWNLQSTNAYISTLKEVSMRGGHIGVPDTVMLRLKVIDLNDCEALSDTITIITHARAQMNDIDPPEVCSGEWVQPINFSTTVISTPAMTYEWEADDNYDDVGLSSQSGVGNIPGFTSNSNTTNAPIVTNITVSPKIGDCGVFNGSDKETFTITVNPVPKMDDIFPQTICSGDAVSGVTFGTPITGTTVTYSWSASGDWSEISPLSYSSGTGDFPGFTAKDNTSNDPYITTITVTPKIGDCDGTPKQFTITVKPKPVLSNIPIFPAICSGDQFCYHPESSTGNPTVIKWLRSYNPDIDEQPDINEQSGDINETLTLANGVTTQVIVTYTLTLEHNGCTNTQYVTVAVRPKPEIAPITGEDKVCKDNSITLNNTTAGGVWKSESENIATVDSYGMVTGISTDTVNIWYVFVDAVTGCSDSVYKEIEVIDNHYNYPDIRLRACPSGTFNLSKYIDTTGVHSISWSGGIIEPNGNLDASKLINRTIYTFKYTVIAGCSNIPKIQKVYLKTIGDNESFPLSDTIAICYEYAKAMNINQLFGIEAGTTSPVASNPPLYITQTNPSLYITETSHGGTIFNGKQFYEDNQPGSATYHGVSNVVMVEFSYTPSGSCLSGITYKRVIVLTPDLTK